jgi:hypothetical protein
MTTNTAETSVTYCANHPDREAPLRCNKCDKPICLKCAVRVATGYRCRECVSQQQQIFETAAWYDYVIAVAVTAVLSGIAGALLTAMGWFIFFLSPVAGGAIAEVVRFAVRKRRGKWLPWAAVGGVALGALPLCALPLLIAAFGVLSGDPETGIGSLFGLLWPLLYVVLCASTLYYRLRGIRLN